MIGVVFALRTAFGATADIEPAAFEWVWRDLSSQHGWTIEAAALERITRDRVAFESPNALRSALSTALGPTLSRTFDGARFEAALRAAAARLARERFVLYADVVPALRELAELNVPRIGLSTGWPAIDQRTAERAGFREPIVFGADLGLTSRDPATFAAVARELRLPAERIWFVAGDALGEIVPAGAAGLRTVWVNRTGVAFPAGHHAPDATIGSLAELPAILGEPYTRGLLALRYIMRTALDWRPGYFVDAGSEPADTPAEPESRSPRKPVPPPSSCGPDR